MGMESEPLEPLDTSEDLDLVSLFDSDEHTADMEARVIQSVLEAGGVPSVIVGGAEMPNIPCDIRVPKARLEEALLLIAESQAAGPSGAEEAEKNSEGAE
jgi:hypothetical protein